MTDDAHPVLGGRVVSALRHLIVSGELAPGERIVERDVAERLGSSRGPVRDAIRTLEHEGLVEVRPYAGATVVVLDRAEIDELVALRRQVEYFAAAGAALRATPAEVDHLRGLADRMLPAFQARDVDALLDLDLAFHLGVCEASHHSTLSVTMRTLFPRLAILMYPSTFDSAAQHTAESFRQRHVDIAEAIAAGDVDAALAAVDVHLDEFFTEIQLIIESGPPAADGGRPDARTPLRPRAVRRRLGTAD